MKLSIIKALIIFIIACIGLQLPGSYSQPRGVLEVIGRMEQDNRPITNGNIRVIVDGAVAQTHNTNMLGRFEFYLQYDTEYFVEFSAPGLITKIIAFDTNMPERASRRTYREFSFVVDLFTHIEAVDLSFFDEELVRIEYNPNTGEFSYAQQETASRLETANRLKRMVYEYLRKKENYDRLIARADNQFDEEELRASRESYISASAIFPEEEYPIERIRIIDELLAQRDAKERKIRDLLFEAEELLAANKAEEAEEAMNAALAVDPEDASIRGRVQTLRQRQTQLRDLAGNYDELIRQADEAYDDSQYLSALGFYKQATEIKPDEEHPRARIAEINNILAELRELRRKYNEAVEKADNYYRILSHENALKYYLEALSYLPEERHPQERIEIINRHLFTAQQRRERYHAAIARGDQSFEDQDYHDALSAYLEASGLKPAETYPKERIVLSNRLIRQISNNRFLYNRAVALGDEAFTAERYSVATAHFRRAIEIKPDKEHPRDMLSQINDILMDQAELEARYKEYIEQADQALSENNLQQAKAKYQEALHLKPNERYPSQKIDEIDGLLERQDIEQQYLAVIEEADRFFNDEDYNEALRLYRDATRLKPRENHPRRQITEINDIFDRQNRLEEQYNTIIAYADRAFDNNNYESAKESYLRAQDIKPDDAYPRERIEQIDQILSDIDAQERYTNLITEADNAFNNANYDQAITKYREALAVRPDEPYPTAKINEAERLISDLQELEQRYNQAIENADRAFNRNNYDEAMTLYQEARDFMPGEQYPRSRIDELNLLLAEQRSLEMQYNELLSNAEEAFNNNNYSRAIAAYENALQLKPDEAFPQEQIEMINNIVAEQERIDQEYRETIANADRQFNRRSFERSRSLYQAASELKPEESYPLNRIEELDRLLARQRGVEQTYRDAVAEADRYFNQENYPRARDAYNRALRAKSDEAYPRERIAEIERILAGQAEESIDYTSAIESGDRYFNQRRFFRARDAYQQALSVRPNEEYPQNRIMEINELLADSDEMDEFYSRGFIDVSNIREVISNNVEKRFYFVPFERRRTGSYLLIRGENLSERNIRLFINYGRDGTRLGGFTVGVGNEEGVQEMKIDISSQRRWISDDCNWVSIYPQGGDLEILQLQIYFGP